MNDEQLIRHCKSLKAFIDAYKRVWSNWSDERIRMSFGVTREDVYYCLSEFEAKLNYLLEI